VLPAQNPLGVFAKHHWLHGWAQYENEGIARHGAKMVTAVATAQVPEIHHHHRRQLSGQATTGMCGRAFNRAFCGMWPNARICALGGEQAASVLATARRDGIEAKGGSLERRRRSRVQATACSTSLRTSRTALLCQLHVCWDDGVIDPS